MTWTSKSKDMGIIDPPTGHGSTKAGVAGRAPGISSITFIPSELFGASARCLYLHLVNPALVTPESIMISRLIEQHVDDTSKYFAVLSSADSFKDYAKSYFSGTVAAGIAYLTMIADGYVWAGHFENEKKAGPGKGNTGSTKAPDFVFARSGHSDVALMESKGTRSETAGAFDTSVEGGYVDQVNPHLGYAIGTSTASHGFSIGAWMTSTTKAEINVHHTDPVTVAPSVGGGPGTITSVQRNDFATAFSLAHSPQLAEQVRAGRIDGPYVPFIGFQWQGYRWLAGGGPRWTPRPYEHDTLEYLYGPYNYFAHFAVERMRAETVLRFVSDAEMPESALELTPMPRDLRERTRFEESQSAVFPDGLAVIGPGADANIEDWTYLRWDTVKAKMFQAG